MLTLTGYRSWAAEQLMAICHLSGGGEAGYTWGGGRERDICPVLILVVWSLKLGASVNCRMQGVLRILIIT